MSKPKVIAVDGPPGTGKTRRIVSLADAWGEDSAVVTYTNDAAAVLRERSPLLRSGTIYSLTWPFVKPFATATRVVSSGVGQQLYSRRRINHLLDPALVQYVDDAPSSRGRTLQDDLAQELHAWSTGPPPFDLQRAEARGALKYLLPLARWVEAGSPIPEGERFTNIAVDEAQDMSAVEMRAAVALAHKDTGEVTCYGDPGQSIFATAKGILGGALPPFWLMSDETVTLSRGYRVGNPVASAASRVLSSYFERAASSFAADHETNLIPWDPESGRPLRGLALGYSRRVVAKYFRLWGLRRSGVVPSVGSADKELVLSTGHAAKGAEADSIYILPWSRPGMKKLERQDPEAVRLLYVMLTRARRRVYLPRSLKARLPL